MIILSIDYSTSSTGYAVFDTEKPLKNSLKLYGVIKPKVEGITKLTYPKGTLLKSISQAIQLKDLIANIKPDKIVMEEVNSGVSRLGQKALDGGHFIFYYFNQDSLNILHMIDSDGSSGWRSKACLNLTLSKNDKTSNNRRRARNKAAREAAKKAKKRIENGVLLPIINKKHKAAEFVNSLFGTDFDVDKVNNHADIADSIGLGVAFIVFVLKLKKL